MSSPLIDREAAYAVVASEQYGLITSQQLKELGLSPAAISRRVRAGALLRVLPEIHRLAGVPRSWHQRVLAVHFWAGSDSVIAGPAAAALHRLDGFALCTTIDVATPRCLRPPAPWVVVRRPRFFSARDRTEIVGIPVMTCARTLIDVSPLVTEARLELAMEDARRRHLVEPRLIEERLAALPANQAGRRKLLRVLELVTGTRPTESALETKVVQMLRREGYPEPIRQEVLRDDGRFAGRVDLVYPERKLIIEVQSHHWHSDRKMGDSDSERTNRHQAMGWLVMEARHSMLHGERRARFLRDLARSYNRCVV